MAASTASSITAAASCLSPCRQVTGQMPSANRKRSMGLAIGDQPAARETHDRGGFARFSPG